MPKKDLYHLKASGQYNHKDENFLAEEICKRLKVPVSYSRDEAWNRLFEKISKPNEKTQKSGRNIMVVYKIVAVLILGIVLTGTLIFTGQHKIVQQNGQKQMVNLPDGSEVTINAGSKLEYNSFLWLLQRKVYLNGEALFRVKKGKTFTVQSTQAEVTVLGTTFNVYDRIGKCRISCIEGSVIIKQPGFKIGVVLKHGQSAEKNRRGFKKQKNIPVTNYAAWTKGEFYYQSTAVSEVFEEIERQFNITIIYKEKVLGKYTGYFNTKNIDTALNMVCLPMQLTYEVNNKQVTIRSLKPKN